MSAQAQHFVAVVGGAVSGSVAAEILAEAGIEVAVIEMNDRPYGKIEDGLPRWHVHQRRKEYERIDARLTQERVHFVPRTKLGRDLGFDELVNAWGVSAVLLANGAWRDRPLTLPGAEDYVGKGLEYQNPFIWWFNHKHEEGFKGRRIHVPDGAVVFGGGLASIDVIKVCQLEIYERALRERGIEVEMLDLEKKGIPAVCEKHGLDPQELGLEGCLLLYRRRRVDMPLAQPVPDATPEQMEKTYAARTKLLGIAQKKYLFRFQDQTLPTELITEAGRIKGTKVVRTEVEGRKATPIEGTEAVIETEFIVSSIGSLPERIEGIRMRGETFDFKDWDLGIYDDEHGVFGVGNVVTGQGNIRASLLHAKKVAGYLMENYFAGALGAAGAETVQQHLKRKEPLPPEKVAELRGRVRQLQERTGYDGDYESWIRQVTPPDLE
ncbi:MAG: NAD(P)-binding protein [Planctomycetota bacterium]|jgi:NADPH-dependent glutamate synthase beta subunit-like oxidoreductase